MACFRETLSYLQPSSVWKSDNENLQKFAKIKKKNQNFLAGINKCCLSLELGYNIGKTTFTTTGTLKLYCCKSSSFEIISRFEYKIFSKCSN